MAKLFLLNSSACNCDFPFFTHGIDKLIAIKRPQSDDFLRNSGIYTVKNYIDLFKTYSQENQARLTFIEQLSPLEEFPEKEEDLDLLFPESFRGFLGIDFDSLDIDKIKCVTDDPSFKKFKSFCQSQINSKTFWEKKEECFSNLLFCGETKKQMHKLGTSDNFLQVINQLTILNDYLITCNNGTFSYKDLKEKTSISISPESASTLAKYGQQRVFSLPTRGTALFELHMKCGDIRIHLLQKEKSNQMFIGYIGPHLDTVTG